MAKPASRHPSAAAGAAAWGGRIFVGAGTLLFIGPGGAADRHAHHAVQLVWAADGEVALTIEHRLRRRAALIPGGLPHTLDASGRRIAIMFIEPHGARGAALDRRARMSPGAEVASDLATIGFPDVFTGDDAATWCDRVLAALGADETASPLSVISRRAIAYVESSIDGRPRLSDAARRAGVSPGRLTHVFSQEVGIPFRRFVLWTRIKQAVAATQNGADLTQAAIGAGFSDSAHLSRTFRSMFGLTPSLVLA